MQYINFILWNVSMVKRKSILDTFSYASFNELWCFNLSICSFWTIVHFLKIAITLLILPWEMCPTTYYSLYDLSSFRKDSFHQLKTFGASSVSPILTTIIKHISMTLFSSLLIFIFINQFFSSWFCWYVKHTQCVKL